MRLNFPNAQPEKIEDGIRQLGRAIKRELGQQSGEVMKR